MSRKRALVLVGVGVAFIVLALAILLAGNQPTASSTPESKATSICTFQATIKTALKPKLA
ncbi:MAG: hypothetical protein GX799_11620 [Crenarchaeota archaeon]|jgi:hypothetical protein|nr:hypothetical protein [Thermoproteota archaeon]